ncbi:Uncharacterised protein [Candidatus Burarchaeum australiense]|nr:Uncharacterised protein [Candidatus Burarchaeum australiense]
MIRDFVGSNYNYYALYLLLVLLLNLLYLAPPFLAASGDAGNAHIFYMADAPLCHQLPQRSLCLIAAPDGSRSVGDCIQQGTQGLNRDRYVFADSRGLGYEFGVCARDTAIYLFMLVGGLAYPFVRRVDDDNAPPLWLFVLAILPTAVDGGGQFIGLWESTNAVRLATGALAGLAVAFYAIPLLYYFIPVAKKAFLGRGG